MLGRTAEALKLNILLAANFRTIIEVDTRGHTASNDLISFSRMATAESEVGPHTRCRYGERKIFYFLFLL